MPVIGEKELKNQIKSGSYSKAYFIYGEESYLKEFYTGKLRQRLVEPAFADFNFHQHEGKDSSMNDILMDASMLPMMSEYSVVLIHDYPFDKSEDEEKLAEFLKDAPESTVLIFWCDSLKVDTKKVKKWDRLIKLFSQYGAAVNLEKRTESELCKLLMNSAAKRGCMLDRPTALYLIATVGGEIQLLFNELEKICAYVSSGDITKDDIDKLAVKSLQARVYDLSKFILKGNSDAAYGVLNALFAQKEDAIPILAVLSSCYVDMYRVKCARRAGVSERELEKLFNYKGREFLIKNAVRDSANIGLRSLREALDVLSDADEKMKSTALDNNLLLEETVAKLLLLRER